MTPAGRPDIQREALRSATLAPMPATGLPNATWSARPRRHAALGRALAAVARPGDLALPVGRSRRRQDPVRQGVRGRPRRRPTRSARRASSSWPSTRAGCRCSTSTCTGSPTPSDALAGGLLDERQADRRHARSNGPSGSAGDPAADAPRRPRSTGPGDDPRDDRARVARARATRRYLEAAPMTGADDAGASSWRIDTATTRIVVAMGSARRRTLDGPRPGPRATATARRCCPPIERLLGEQDIATLAARRRSWSARARARSPACASGSRRPRRSPTGSACRSSASRPREALLAARRARRDRRRSLLLPAGPSDRIVVRDGRPARACCPGGQRARARPATSALVAVDLDGRAPADAPRRGEAARAGSRPALLRSGPPGCAPATPTIWPARARIT